MRRFWNLRLLDRDYGEEAVSGFDPLDLPGDPIAPVDDEGWCLRPLSADIPSHHFPQSAAGPEEAPTQRAVRRARELADLGRRLDAVIILRQLLDDSPNERDARACLATLLEDGGDTEDALAELDLALTVGTIHPDLLVQRGGLLTRMGRPEQAEIDLRRALRTVPDHAEARHQLGIALLRRGRGAEAVAELRGALDLAPDQGLVAFHLGEAHHLTGDLPGAQRALELATRLAPNEPRYWQRLGRVFDQMGRTEEAMSMYKKAREVSIT